MLELSNIHAQIKGKQIIKGLNLEINRGEIHAVMGPNGSGKSTLAKVLMGHPDYKVKSNPPAGRAGKGKAKSEILLDGESLFGLEPNERAKAGLFLAFQHPVSVTGVSIANFLRSAKQAQAQNNEFQTAAFMRELKDKAKELNLEEECLKRSLNAEFSGGEKKKLEMLQLAILQPKYAVVDEIDTGVDIDALKLVAKSLTRMVKKNNTGVLMITHYQRILSYIEPDFVHVLIAGELVETGGYQLAAQIESKGYNNFK